ncbi:uncharacterized protein LOC121677960 [Alosa sapidissima]|uniref:uncharacterized protein LOC121677960 n=1 Tax=Alosa sapidissima TaxID=34773 RepID=UPI001C09BB07|nr:uncharacterized protein LOC121677960 [Alosa sapidissima]
MTEPTDRNLLSRKESRSVRFLMVDPAVDCYLGDAHDLCETDEEKTRSGSSGGSQFTSGSGSLAVCTRSYSSASFCKEDERKSSRTIKRDNRGDCYLSDVSSYSELDLKESRCVSALRTDPAVDCYLGDALDLCETDEEETRSGSSGGSQFTSGSGSLAVCTRSYSSASFCKYEKDERKSGRTIKRDNRGDCYLSDVSSCSEEDERKSSRTIKRDNRGDCYLSDVSSCSELKLDLKESRCVSALRTDPAVDCYLGDALDLCETDEEKTRSGSSGGSQFTSGSGSLAVCTRSYSSASFCKEDERKSGRTIKRDNRGDCYLSDVSSCSELKLDLKESRCVSALRTDPAVDCYLGDALDLCEYEEDDGKSGSTAKRENRGDCYLSDVSSWSELKESRSVSALRTDPAVDCYLGDALDLCESDRKDYQLIELPRQGKNSVSPTVMVYDLPPRPARPVLQCWEGPLVATETDTVVQLLKVDTGSDDVTTETDTVVQLLKVDVGSDDVTMETDTVVQLLKVRTGSDDVTMETDAVVQLLKVEDALDNVTMETDTVVQMLKVDNGVTLAAPALYWNESDLVLTSLDEDDFQGGGAPSGAIEISTSHLSNAPGGPSVAASDAAARRDVLQGLSGGGLPDAWLELEHVLETNMANMRQEVRLHLDGVEHTLNSDLQLRKRLREEERWAERHRQKQRLEGMPMWLRRLRNALKGLVKRRPKSGRTQPDDSAAAASSASSASSSSSSSSAAAGSDGSGYKELCHVAQSACHSQVVLERTRKAHALAMVRQAAARDERMLSQVLEQLDDTERNFQKQKELMLQDVENTLDRLHIRTGNSGGPVDMEEERSKEDTLKSKKPKKMGLKRRFFRCLRCFT